LLLLICFVSDLKPVLFSFSVNEEEKKAIIKVCFSFSFQLIYDYYRET